MANSDRVRTSAANAGANELRTIWDGCNGNKRTSNLVRAGSCPMVCLARSSQGNERTSSELHRNGLAATPDAFSPFEVDCPDETRHFIMEGNGGLTWEGRIAAATKLWLTQHHFCHASDVVVWSPPVMM